MHPFYRRKGITRRLYQAAEHWTRLHGYHAVALYIRADNDRSQSIHIRHGARQIGLKRAEQWADGSIADTYCFKMDVATFDTFTRTLS